VLAGTTVTNTGSSTISGDVGVSPGSAITGFPPGLVNGGSIHATDGVANSAQAGLTTAYLDAAGRTPTTPVSTELGGRSLVAGVYSNASALGLTGTVTLNGQGNPNSVFIFQAGSTLITASSSHVSLIGGAQACNVFWQVGSSATVGTGSSFVGTIMALTSITVKTGATISGRALARNGQVSLDANVIRFSACTAAATTTTTSETIPTGAPHTGFGGASQGANTTYLVLGGLALVTAVATAGGALRRSRYSRRSNDPESPSR